MNVVKSSGFQFPPHTQEFWEARLVPVDNQYYLTSTFLKEIRLPGGNVKSLLTKWHELISWRTKGKEILDGIAADKDGFTVALLRWEALKLGERSQFSTRLIFKFSYVVHSKAFQNPTVLLKS
ncbi:hypothetical protein OUZ56_002539 [Daphnia magna]|uniref:Uncharacterized protein n=1 Tax=Daphnia magna TaxID=35525 RepID=A0ABR0A6F6_9CRUS|nr:hypothetical protein OUZ56_002539 [Daphnia magna]